MKADQLRYEYERAVGHPPTRLPADDPLAYQWDPRVAAREKLNRCLPDRGADGNQPELRPPSG